MKSIGKDKLLKSISEEKLEKVSGGGYSGEDENYDEDMYFVECPKCGFKNFHIFAKCCYFCYYMED